MDDAKEFVQVAIPIPLRKTFDYAVPEVLRGRIEVGSRVRVPFSRREVEGYCVGFVPESEYDKVRDILDVIDEVPMLDAELLELTKWMSDYYFCSWGEALDAVLPTAVREGTQTRKVRLAKLKIPLDDVDKVISEIEAKAPKQAKVLAIIAENDGTMTASRIAKAVGCTPSVVRSLEKAGRIVFLEEKAILDPLLDLPVDKVSRFEPNDEQAVALKRVRERLAENTFGVILLHGVTSSGKTEIYLQAIAGVVAAGKQAIVLVPEISLTPQTIRRFRARFDRVAVMHSRMSKGETHEQWRQIRSGEAQIVLGVRSAVFAPTKNLGLIVVDEEHENTFKQDVTPRYHTRDVAVVRAHRSDALVLLGSATPSLESYRNAMTGKYELVRLTKRIEDRPLPVVHVVDMRGEHHAQKRFAHFSRDLLEELRRTIARGEQAILFLNRRGFATTVSCRKCGLVLECVRCGIAMTYHKSRHVAVCHQCGARLTPPDACPDCQTPDLRFTGAGTEKIEEYLGKLVPEANVARMDTDTMTKRGSYRETLDRFRSGEVNVLLGTQMIAKGLDYPNVTLVGIISADTALHLQDFRASERTFQLISQVSGRAGRGVRPGAVIVQTHKPGHYCIECAARHDYEKFADVELEHRRALGYPPFSRVARIVVRGLQRNKVIQKANQIAAKLRESGLLGQRQLLGPAQAPIERVKERARWHMLVKAPESRTLRAILSHAEEEMKSSGGVYVTVDVDPMSML
ncbi:MAG: primosomal protein N' [Planctomycetes bacterium]|nr:primosomal protein N' [Planctomycetota bacterium]